VESTIPPDMMRSATLLLVVVLGSPFAPKNPIQAQDSGVTRVYVDQFSSLYSQAQKLGQTFEEGKASGEALIGLERQNLALVKLIHGLAEDAGKDNLEQMKRGQAYNRDLALIVHGCGASELALESAQDYAETGDRAFLGIAHSAEAIAADIRKLFPR
jgi:hypothetical protein